jgi:pilus assembly protein CpaC
MDAHEVPPVPGFEVTKPSQYEFWKYNMTEGSPDTGYYHLPPYGSGSVGTNVDYQHFNPGPAGSMYSPVPTSPMSNARGISPGPGVTGSPMSAPPMTSPPMSGPSMSAPTMSNPQPSQGRLYLVPQSSMNGARQGSQRYSNQVMMPGNNSGVRQVGYEQPAAPPANNINQKRY